VPGEKPDSLCPAAEVLLDGCSAEPVITDSAEEAEREQILQAARASGASDQREP